MAGAAKLAAVLVRGGIRACVTAVAAGALAGCGASASGKESARPARTMPTVPAATSPPTANGGGGGASAPRSRRPAADRGRLVVGHFWSSALHQRRMYLIYLPPGYAAEAARGVRFPVLYLLHTAVGTPWRFVRGTHVDAVLRQELARHLLRPMLLVMVDGRQYGGTRDTEFANIRLGRYMDVVLETVRAVDRRWSTIRDRRARMLAGISTGGYAAANVTLHHLDMFGGFESWSGYFVQTREHPFTYEPESVLVANSPSDYVLGLRRQLRRLPTWGFAYQGSYDRISDAAEMVQFIRLFDRAGGHGTYAIWYGGHNIRLWEAHLPEMLRWASQRMRAPTG